VLKNYNNNDYEVHVDLHTHIKEETFQNSGTSSSKDQHHDNIALGRPNHATRSPPIRYDFEDLIFYVCITSSRNYTTF